VFHKEVQVPYFEFYLKNIGKAPDFKVKLFDTGKKKWLQLKFFKLILIQSHKYQT